MNLDPNRTYRIEFRRYNIGAVPGRSRRASLSVPALAALASLAGCSYSSDRTPVNPDNPFDMSKTDVLVKAGGMTAARKRLDATVAERHSAEAVVARLKPLGIACQGAPRLRCTYETTAYIPIKGGAAGSHFRLEYDALIDPRRAAEKTVRLCVTRTLLNPEIDDPRPMTRTTCDPLSTRPGARP